MRRICLILATIIFVISILTSCGIEKDKDIVHVKNNEKEVSLFSQETVEVNLKITIDDNGKKETVKINRKVPQNESTIIHIADIPGADYWGEQAKIFSVDIEKVETLVIDEYGGAILTFVLVGLVLGLFLYVNFSKPKEHIEE